MEYKCCPWLDLEGQPPFAPFSMKFCFLNVGSLPHTWLPSPVPDPVMGMVGAEEQSLKSPLASCKVFKSGIGLLLELVEFPLKCHEETLELVRIQTWAVIWAQRVERNSTGFANFPHLVPAIAGDASLTRACCTVLSFAKLVVFLCTY